MALIEILLSPNGQISGALNCTTTQCSFNDEYENLAKQESMKDKVAELRKMLQAGWRTAMPPTRN